MKNLKNNYFIPFYVNKDFINKEDEKNNKNNKNFYYKSFSPINIKNNNISDLFNNLREKSLNNSNKIKSNLNNKNNIKNNKINVKNNKIYEKRKNDVKNFSEYFKI